MRQGECSHKKRGQSRQYAGHILGNDRNFRRLPTTNSSSLCESYSQTPSSSVANVRQQQASFGRATRWRLLRYVARAVEVTSGRAETDTLAFPRQAARYSRHSIGRLALQTLVACEASKRAREALVARIGNREMALFAGAGVSVPAGFPSWSALLQRLETMCDAIAQGFPKDERIRADNPLGYADTIKAHTADSGISGRSLRRH